MKKAISILLAVVMVFSFAACSDTKQKESNKSVTENVNDKKVDFSAELTDIPERYKEKVKSGSLPTEEIEYNHDGHTKKAVVYLPPNYDAKKRYNVLYIIPGYNGNHTVIFGNAREDTMFKNVLDNMISNGDIEPMIAVTPDFYTDSKERLNQDNFDYLVNDFKEEVTGVLIPTVESKYSTTEPLQAAQWAGRYAGTFWLQRQNIFTTTHRQPQAVLRDLTKTTARYRTN